MFVKACMAADLLPAETDKCLESLENSHVYEKNETIACCMQSVVWYSSMPKRYAGGNRKENRTGTNKAIFMIQKGKIAIDEIAEYFPELSEEDRKEIKSQVLQQV